MARPLWGLFDLIISRTCRCLSRTAAQLLRVSSHGIIDGRRITHLIRSFRCKHHSRANLRLSRFNVVTFAGRSHRTLDAHADRRSYTVRDPAYAISDRECQSPRHTRAPSTQASTLKESALTVPMPRGKIPRNLKKPPTSRPTVHIEHLWQRTVERLVRAESLIVSR